MILPITLSLSLTKVNFMIISVRRKEHMFKHYGVKNWTDPEDFLKQVAIKKGRLKKGGEPDVMTTAKLILIDWQRGELPYFTLPEG